MHVTGNHGASVASQFSMYRLDPELVERRARLLDAPPTRTTKRRLAIVDDLIAGRSPTTSSSAPPARRTGMRWREEMTFVAVFNVTATCTTSIA
jgi:hypothetical protein